MRALVNYLDHAGAPKQVEVTIRRPGLFVEGREEYYAVALDTLGCGPTRDSASGAAIALVRPHAREVRGVWFVPPAP